MGQRITTEAPVQRDAEPVSRHKSLPVMPYIFFLQEFEAILPTQTIWKFHPNESRALKVFFMSDKCKQWKYKGKSLTKCDILNLAMVEWSRNLALENNGKYVPFFLPTDTKSDAKIRVEFEGMYNYKLNRPG